MNAVARGPTILCFSLSPDFPQALRRRTSLALNYVACDEPDRDLFYYVPGCVFGGSRRHWTTPSAGCEYDALDLTTGFLLNGLNGNFVTVDDEPGNVPDASLTTSGNVYGWVPTSLPDREAGTARE